MKLPEASGIYRIRNLTNNKFYVGSAVNMRKRGAEHKSALSRSAHHSQPLQRAWAKYEALGVTRQALHWQVRSRGVEGAVSYFRSKE